MTSMKLLGLGMSVIILIVGKYDNGQHTVRKTKMIFITSNERKNFF